MIYLSLQDKRRIESAMVFLPIRDEITYDHSVRTALISKDLAKKIYFDNILLDDIFYIAMIHDIGKLSIPPEIKNKSSKLTEEEMRIMKLHPEVGFDMMKNLTNNVHILSSIRFHHERPNGKGYPDRLKDKEIPFYVKLISISDVFEAVTSENRPYRKRAEINTALEIIKKEGHDPNLIKLLSETVSEKYVDELKNRRKKVDNFLKERFLINSQSLELNKLTQITIPKLDQLLNEYKKINSSARNSLF